MIIIVINNNNNNNSGQICILQFAEVKRLRNVNS